MSRGVDACLLPLTERTIGEAMECIGRVFSAPAAATVGDWLAIGIAGVLFLIGCSWFDRRRSAVNMALQHKRFHG